MESSKGPKLAADPVSSNIMSSPVSEDTAQLDASQNIQSTSSSKNLTLQNPPMPRKRNQSGTTKGAVISNKANKATSKQFQKSRAGVSKPARSNISSLIFMAINRRKSGISMEAVKKAVINMGYDMTKNKYSFQQAFKRMLTKGHLRQLKGSSMKELFMVNPDMEKKKRQQLIMKGKNGKAKKGKKERLVATNRRGRSNKRKVQMEEFAKRSFMERKMPLGQASKKQKKIM